MRTDRFEKALRPGHNAAVAAALTAIFCCTAAVANDADRSSSQSAIGKNTRAWLDEQRNDVNRAEPEPWPASRAAAAVQRYEATIGTDSGSSATRSGTALGIRSGTAASGGSSGSPAGMGR